MKTLKSLIATGIIGAGLIFGNLNKAKAQCECQTFNHDQDEFQEEIICYKTNETGKKNDIERYTFINYSDEDNDNFYESIKVFNCDMVKKSGGGAHIVIFNIEDFYVDKSTGLINYNWERCSASRKEYLDNYTNKLLIDVVKEDIPESFNCLNIHFGQSLTRETIYSLYPKWDFYGGFGERVKKIINAGEDEAKLKNLVSDERSLWGKVYRVSF